MMPRLPLLRLDIFDYILVDIRRLGAHLVVEVGPVERRLEDRGIEHAQVLLDIVLHLGGGSGREGDNGFYPYLVDDGSYAAILGTEVVPPLRDTVRLVDSIERDVYLTQKVDILFLGKRLGCDIQQFGFSRQYITLDLIDCRFVERGVYKVSHTVFGAEVAHGIDLVFHQCNQRRNDDGRPVENQGR